MNCSNAQKKQAVTSEPQHSESKASGVTERDDVYYYMGERLKLERETEDSGV